jgi:hypothetical protein
MTRGHAPWWTWWTWLPACALAWAGAVSAQPTGPGGNPAAAWTLDRSSTAVLAASPGTAAAVAQFAASYTKAGKPRMVLFWNRELDDRVGAESREVTRINTHRSGDGNDYSLTASQGRESSSAPQRSNSLSERDLWLVETEFTQRMLDAGAALVDRAAIVRITAAGTSAPTSMPSIEMSALAGKADLLLEVLLTRDPSAPLGWGFRCNLKEVRSGRVLGSQYLSAMPELPPRGEPGFRAGPKGYERVEAEPVKLPIRAVGETLAAQAMSELARRLAPR